MKCDLFYRGETKVLDSDTRATTPGCFVRLTDGFTHYELGGRSLGPTAVLLHGFSVPYFIWDPTFDALSSAGLEVLRYDLFGRGFSDRPNLQYDIKLFVRQLQDLLEVLHIQNVALIGLSMGAPIAAAFTIRQPNRVNKLVLIDPIGTAPMALNFLYKTATLPGISEIILGLAGTEKMVKSVASDFFDPALVEGFQDKYRVQMQYRGFKRAILSSLRNNMLNGFPEVYEQLGKLNNLVLMLWGRQDTTLPIKQSEGILRAVPQTEFHIVENAGHVPHYEKPETVNPILLKFLN